MEKRIWCLHSSYEFGKYPEIQIILPKHFAMLWAERIEIILVRSLTNFQDETWAEFSTLEDAICVTSTYRAVPTNTT